MTIPIENNLQVSVLVTSAVSIVIATVAVTLRLIGKRIANRIDLSDYCIVAALISNTALHATGISLVTHGGFGFHIGEIIERFGLETVTFFFKGIMSFALLWNVVVCFSKLSVLLMYTALIPTPSLIKWAQGLGLLVIMWNVSNILAGLLICRPIQRNWNFTIPGSCGSQPDYYFSMGIVNLVTDAAIIILPMPYLYKLQLTLHKKLLAMGLLSIGIGTWVITIYRQALLPGLNFADMPYSGVLATLLSGLEPAVAIVLACVPLMRPLFGRSLKSNSSGYNSGNNSVGLHSKQRSANKKPEGTFSELVDDVDDSSQVRLQPIKDIRHTGNCVSEEHGNVQVLPNQDHSIAVQKKWEISRQ